MTAKKAVLQLSVHEERIRKKAFVTVSRSPGVSSITMDDKTGKMTVVGEVDVPVLVMKLRKLCNAEIVSVEVVKPPEKKPEPAKPDPAKPAEIVAYPVTHMNYSYQYHSSYANSHYQPFGNSRVVVEEPNTCVLM
ncbi:heavy metal-associated isoprenylated plant protein 13 [Raphanus sativus]|uniref:Heavy metal-associated isoprenylated plant protein 13 n=1 Tax=Raphanus sativus TaxID=3726 RepID=A0A9W3CI97_RAPSA|nr:heavy metal-associated isoprenylated plant protein 13 [Raphanus sativus]XP_056851226.1 heavy metal-associated isoprenylated plant protein 13 [Raphanus sativus]XP_056851227.1 heavy metal-associated isoprenylated plant protein 13 [Raphanus sativus]